MPDDFFSLDGMKRAFELKVPPMDLQLPATMPPFNGELLRARKVQKAINRRQAYLAAKKS